MYYYELTNKYKIYKGFTREQREVIALRLLEVINSLDMDLEAYSQRINADYDYITIYLTTTFTLRVEPHVDAIKKYSKRIGIKFNRFEI